MQHVLTIEWDGKPPSSTYYKRVRDGLGLHVRGDKKLSPLVRRAAETEHGTGVFVQEGCLVCASKSLARAVASYAASDGAKLIMIGTANGEFEPFQMTDEDVRVMAQIESVLGRRGRPTGETFDIVLTCLECCNSFQFYDVEKLVNCPTCHGVNVRKRVGQMHAYRPPSDTEDPFAYWQRTRFASSHYELAGLNGAEPPASVSTYLPNEKRAVDLIAASTQFLAEIVQAAGNVDTAVRWLDYVFTARCYCTSDERLMARTQAIMKLVQIGYKTSGLSLAEDDDQLDLFDISHFLSVRDVVDAYAHLHPTT